jgi:hypothetical protein
VDRPTGRRPLGGPDIIQLVNSASDRQQQIAGVVADPPPVHGPAAGDKQVWATETDCYDFLARHVESGSRTLETGCGISTALFTLWGAEHTCVVYSQQEADILSTWAHERGVDTAHLRFEIGPSDDVLPRLDPTELDLVLVDGSHAFPAPIIDWFYAAGRLRDEGIVVLDDLQLAAVRLGLIEFLAKDPRWELIAHTGKWAAFVRRSSGSLREEWTEQRFLGE